MIIFKKIIAVSAFLAIALPMLGQSNYIVEVNFDKKIIHVDALHLPSSASAQNVMLMLPELLDRPADKILSNYAISVNDVDMGSARDVILAQMRLADIEKIEVCDNALESYQNNGQGGSINFVLKEPDKGLSGNASLEMGYPWDVMPGFGINYKNDKLELNTLFKAETYDPNNMKQVESVIANGSTTETLKSTDQRFWTETGAAILNYHFNAKNELDVSFAENATHDKQYLTTTVNNGVSKSTTNTRTFSTMLKGSFNHFNSNSSKFHIEGTYTYTPVKNLYDQVSNYQQMKNNGNLLSGKVSYSTPLLAPTSPNQVKWELGVTTNYNFGRDVNYDDYIGTKYKDYVDAWKNNNYTWHIMPYTNIEAHLGQFALKTILEFQHFHYKLENERFETVHADRNDFTAKLMIGWQFKKHQHLRLMFDRKLQRPTNDQMYPYVIYRPVLGNFYMGNEDLLTMLVHSAELDYITDHTTDHTAFIFNAGLRYIHTSDIIKVCDGDGIKFPGFMLPFKSYENNGHSNIVNGNMMIYYRVNKFAISFTGNVFNNATHDNVSKNHYTYFNLKLTPTVDFDNDWLAALNLVYNSKVETKNSSLGACCYAKLTIDKKFGAWDFNIYGQLTLTGKTKDINYGTNSQTNIYHRLVKNAIGAGFRYEF